MTIDAIGMCFMVGLIVIISLAVCISSYVINNQLRGNDNDRFEQRSE